MFTLADRVAHFQLGSWRNCFSDFLARILGGAAVFGGGVCRIDEAAREGAGTCVQRRLAVDRLPLRYHDAARLIRTRSKS